MVKAELVPKKVRAKGKVKAKPKAKRGAAIAKALTKHEKAVKTDPVLALEQKAIIPRLRELAERNGLKLTNKGGNMRIVGKIGRRKVDEAVVDPASALKHIFGSNRDPYAAVALAEIIGERELSNSFLAFQRSVKTTKPLAGVTSRLSARQFR